ncbi:hypothetical protein [Cellulomonas iranensis]|uniref:Uncharacterized protein n=1 Tax=Cellulomonas iranensis TaxID=76862 RepID=A0ABU0GM28_9CELL|nr:hypothetical protein [Cellulomonas iranensis]MDQ0426416.1 hypothetical protein [Cellulomonas iranensis]
MPRTDAARARHAPRTPRTPLTAVVSVRLGVLVPVLAGLLLALGTSLGDPVAPPLQLVLVAAVGATGLAVAGALLVPVAAVLLGALPRTGPAPASHPRAPRTPARQQDPTAAGRPHPRAPGATTLPRALRTA